MGVTEHYVPSLMCSQADRDSVEGATSWLSKRSFPDLYSYVFEDSVDVTEAEAVEYFFERERRFEEYLLILNNVSKLQHHVKQHTWDDAFFYKGPDLEEAFRLFPYKLPAGTSLDISREAHVMALEWGSPDLDDTQWCYVAYETLLLIYAYLVDENMARETALLPLRDIQLLLSNEKAVQSVEDDAGCGTLVQDSVDILRSLVMLMRVKLGLDGKENELISSLTIPSGFERGRMGQFVALHPLDVRYRAARLLDAWQMAENNFGSPSSLTENETFLCWCRRQLHVLHTALSFKLWRLSRFLPGNKSAIACLHGWPDRGPWYRRLQKHIHLTSSIVPHTQLNYKVNVLLHFLLRGLALVTEISDKMELKACKSERVVGKPDVGDVKQTILFLIHTMSCIEAVDKSLSLQIHRLKADGGSGSVRLISNNPRCQQPAFPTDVDVAKRRSKNAESQGREERHKSSSANAFLNPHWAYELPLIHLIMSYLWTVAVDPSTNDGFHASSGVLAQGLLLVSSVLQTGFNICESQRSRCLLTFSQDKNTDHNVFPVINLSLQTHALLLVKAVWETLCNPPDSWGSNSQSNGFSCGFSSRVFQSSENMNGVKERSWFTSSKTKKNIRLEFLQRLRSVIEVAGFIQWLAGKQTAKHLAQKTVAAIVSCVCHVVLDHHGNVGNNAAQVGIVDWNSSKKSSPDDTASPQVLSAQDFLSHFPWDFWGVELLMAKVPCYDRFDQENQTTRSEPSVQKDYSDSRGGSSPPSDCSQTTTDMFYATKEDLAETLVRRRRRRPNKQHWKLFRLNEFLAKTQQGVMEQKLLLDGNVEKVDLMQELDTRHEVETHYDASRDASFHKNREQYALETSLKPIVIGEAPNVSLVSPGNVERIVMEVLYTQLITARCRADIVDTLCDYRHYLEPEALPLLIDVWHKMNGVVLGIEAFVQNSTSGMSRLLSNAVGRNSFSNCDFYRYFISQSVARLIARLFAEARSKAALFQSSVVVAARNPLEKDDERTIVQLYADAVQKLVQELRGELLFYTESWAPLLPAYDHAVVVVKRSCRDLNVIFKEFLLGPWWPEDDMPSHGAQLLQEIHAFENLVQEVELNSRSVLDEKFDDIIGLFSTSVSAALTKRFTAMDATLTRCLATESWTRVPGNAYSVTMVDFFAFIHHVVFVMSDVCVPAEWIVPHFLQFLRQTTHVFMDFFSAKFRQTRFVSFHGRIVSIFESFLQPKQGQLPKQRVCTGRQWLEGRREAQDTEKRGLIHTVRHIAGKKKEKSNFTASMKSYPLSAHCDEEKPFYNVSCCDPEAAAKPKSSKNSGVLTGKSTRHSEKQIFEQRYHTLLLRFGPYIASTYLEISEICSCFPLQCCLTLLYNLRFFSEQLPSLGLKVKTFAETAITKRDPEHHHIAQALQRTAALKSTVGAETGAEHTGSGATQESELRFSARLSNLSGLLKDCVKTCWRIVTHQTVEVCRYIVLRLLVYDLGEEFFEELYQPTFAQSPLQHILRLFQTTLERFVEHAPHCYRLLLERLVAEYVVKSFGQLWCFILSEMGYHGIVFLPEDIEVLTQDAQALKVFCAAQYEKQPSGQFLFAGNDESETVWETVPEQAVFLDQCQSCEILTQTIDDFFQLLKTQPDIFARLGETFRSPLNIPTPKSLSTRSPSTEKLPYSTSPSPSCAGELNSAFRNEAEPSSRSSRRKRKKTWFRNFLGKRKGS